MRALASVTATPFDGIVTRLTFPAQWTERGPEPFTPLSADMKETVPTTRFGLCANELQAQQFSCPSVR